MLMLVMWGRAPVWTWRAEKLQDQQGVVKKEDSMGAHYAKEEQVLCLVYKSCMRV